MKISSRLDYAVSCVLRVADKFWENKPVTVSEVAKLENIEPDYVEQLLIILKRAGVIKSIRGSKGGYVLAKDPRKITARDVVSAFEKEILELACHRKKGRRNKCVHLNDCRLRSVWIGLRDEMEGYLKSVSLAELLKLRRQERSFKKGGKHAKK